MTRSSKGFSKSQTSRSDEHQTLNLFLGEKIKNLRVSGDSKEDKLKKEGVKKAIKMVKIIEDDPQSSFKYETVVKSIERLLNEGKICL